ncbi:phage-shock protein [Desulfotomaculum nigrificans]|uniref:phage-shock protein n=1 Tax=Desulfotomaculum nigrificans TaxID=1565 RepID=UPI00030968E7|nr:phage-shock protein [Desulfotomaculum nigrificans]
MVAKLNSLTDVLKKTLYFFDGLSVDEISPYVQKKMLQDCSTEMVTERITLCLKQHQCFYTDENGKWRLKLQGFPENDHFYAMLIKRQQPMALRQIVSNSVAKRKRIRKLAEEAALIPDGRFVQLDNGNWGLTEWNVESEQYSLKHLVIKALKLHQGGLSTQQLFEIVNTWRPTSKPAVQQILNKFPYFERVSSDVWIYNQPAHVLYDDLIKRYLKIIQKQKNKWQNDRQRWTQKTENLARQLQEIGAAQKEAAAALAQRASIVEQYNHLATQLSEKDLLLNLRKKEILRYRHELERLDNKANSILYQCRLWVRRAREAESEVARLRQSAEKTQNSLEGLFSKLQQYKERDRENKARLAELKERYSTRVAELQTEIVELKQKLEKYQDKAGLEERRLHQDINILSNDLKEALEEGEDLQKSLRLTQQELARVQEEKLQLEKILNRPLVKLVSRVSTFFGW